MNLPSHEHPFQEHPDFLCLRMTHLSLRVHPLPLLFSPPPASSPPIPDIFCVLPSPILSILAAPGLLLTISIRVLLVPWLHTATYVLLAPCLHPVVFSIIVNGGQEAPFCSYSPPAPSEDSLQ